MAEPADGLSVLLRTLCCCVVQGLGIVLKSLDGTGTSTLPSLAFFASLRTFRIFFLLPALGHFLKKTRRKFEIIVEVTSSGQLV